MSLSDIGKVQINAAEQAVINNLAAKGLVKPQITIQTLLDFLIKHGGTIISSNDLPPMLIEQAKASGRMYVDENSFGFIWEPPIAGLFPENEDDLEMFECCYPLPVEVDVEAIDPEKILYKDENSEGDGYVSPPFNNVVKKN